MAQAEDPHLDPELAPLLETFPAIPLNAETLPGFRAAVAEMAPLPDPSSHAEVLVEQIEVPGPADTVRCLRFAPAVGPARGTLLHVHGGGFVMGLPEMDALRNIALVEALGCAILSPDYRLAPENPHPAGLEDCHAALAWLAAEAGGPVGLVGESAGGGLAASLALIARDRGTGPLACQALIYPMLAPPGHSVAHTREDQRIGRYIWPAETDRYAWRANLGSAAPDPATLAGLATDLAGLPPAFIAVGELDLFVHDDLAYASRLLAAGVSVEAHCYPGAFHGFDRMAEAQVSRRFARDLIDFLRHHLG